MLRITGFLALLLLSTQVEFYQSASSSDADDDCFDFKPFPAARATSSERLLRQQQQLASFMQFYDDPENHPGEPHPNYTDVEPTNPPCNPSEPLYLTPYVDTNRAAEGRAAALVNLPDEVAKAANIRSYAGFFTVNASDFGNLYFWLFETTNKSVARPEERPLAVWLQGGPGGSSLYGLFTLNGPFGVNKDGALYRRTPYSWLETVNLLYIDQPVGTGFSFTSTAGGYAKNEEQIGWNLYDFMTQFYKIFPNYLKSDFYIFGESYAGKYVPAFAYRVHERNLNSGGVKIPLTGIAVGDGLTDPENMIEALGPLMFNFGIATAVERDYITNETQAIKKLIQERNFKAARPRFADLLTGSPRGSYFTKISGSTSYYNILFSQAPPEEWYYQPYLKRCDVRRAIHVGNLSYGGHASVKLYLDDDFLDTVRHWLPPLIDNYRVMYYTGQLDIIVGVPMTERFLRLLEGWSWKNEYLNTDRTIWKVNGRDRDVAGYVKQVRGSFYQVVIRGAGHMVPHDQPERAFNMIQRFVERQSFGNVTAAHYQSDDDGAWLFKRL